MRPSDPGFGIHVEENMIRQNLHTHSIYDDGKDTIDQMVRSALDKGFTVLGFSGHGCNPIDECSMSAEDTRAYIHDVKQARETAREQGLQIFCGIEEDSLSPVDPKEWDYIIGSVHYLQKDGKAWPVDYSREKFEEMLEEGWQGNIHALLVDYWKAVKAQTNNEAISIAGHIDLIAKYNEKEEFFAFDDPVYLQAASEAIESLAEAGKIFEMNTGAMARGYRSEPYPHPLLLDKIHQAGGRLLINTDCHNREKLDLGLKRCLDLAKEAGFTTLMTLTEQGFEERDIEEFAPERPAC